MAGYSIWFVVPVHGRLALTAVCLRQLRRTCDIHGDSTAVVVGDDPSLDLAERLGFATVRRNNDQLGRKFNDGYQLACDPAYNPHPAEYVVPCGSDDWVDPAILNKMPGDREVGLFRRHAIVNEQRTMLARCYLRNLGGGGIRIIPRRMLEHAEYRPAPEDQPAGVDTCTYRELDRATGGFAEVDLDVHDLQIVDWKTEGQQLHRYRSMGVYVRSQEPDPCAVLQPVYPDAVAEMRTAAA